MATDREKLEHLLAGGLLFSTGMYKRLKGDTIVWTLPEVPEGSNYETPTGIVNFDESEIYIEPKWWDSIPPEGILCKVWDNCAEPWEFQILYIHKYEAEEDYSFESNENVWKNAVPLNEEQLAAYEILKSIGT